VLARKGPVAALNVRKHTRSASPRPRLRFAGVAALNDYEKALAEYNITEGEARLYLQWQITLVSFIDVRFNPEVQLKDSKIQDYDNSTDLPDWRLNRWLARKGPAAALNIRKQTRSASPRPGLRFAGVYLRRQTRIRFHAKVLQ
jgi:hypothetical protein